MAAGLLLVSKAGIALGQGLVNGPCHTQRLTGLFQVDDGGGIVAEHGADLAPGFQKRSEEHTSELQSH